MGISQENVAEELGISHSAYAKIERGVTDPSLSRLFELARIFKVEITHFFKEDQSPVVGESPYNNGQQEIEKLNKLIIKLLTEIDTLRTEIAESKKVVKGKKK